MSQANPNSFKYFRLKTLAARLDVHRSTIWRWVRQGTFPRPISLNPTVRVWRETDIEKWITDRQASSAD